MKRSILIGCCFLIILSCKDLGDSIQISEDFTIQTIIEIMKKPTTISKEKLAEIAEADEEKIKIYNENFSPDVSKRMVLYSWPNGQKESIKTRSGKELNIEKFNSLGMGLVKRISKKDFQNQFESKDFVQSEIDRITNDPDIPTDIAISEAKYLAKNSKIQKFEKWENIGELAYWETPVNALHVFVDGISFTVTTNFPDEKLSRNKAIAFTKLIIENPLNN